MFAALNSFQVGGKPTPVSDVFSTTLYIGNGAAQSITNGINLSAYGGLVWLKNRQSANGHWLSNTARGINKYLQSQNTDAEVSSPNSFTAFNINGFSIGSGGPNNPSENYVSWTFRKQPLFFDVVTYTGTGSNTTIAHNLDSVPGCIIVKRTDTTADWAVYHRSLANTEYLILNTTAAKATGATWWNSTTPTSTVFSVGTDASVNASGGTYVAYLFAHDAGGFSPSGNDNVISCGSFTTDGSGNFSVNLGYEPQYFLTKRTDDPQNWYIWDTMRGWTASGTGNGLVPNLSDAETNYFGGTNYFQPTATGVVGAGGNFFGLSATVIYIAIKAS